MTSAEVRAAAAALRRRIDSGDLLSNEEAVAACVTMEDAKLVFEREDDNVLYCCGAPITVSSGVFGTAAWCPTCGARVVDAIGPTSSPFLPRTSGCITIPSKEWTDRFGDRTWLVMHPGDRP